MAKSKTPIRSEATDAGIPEGFDIRANRIMGDGWLIKREGVSVIGRLLGRVENGTDDKGNVKYFFQIALDERSLTVEASTGSGEDTETVTLSPGHIVNVDASVALDELHKYSTNGGIYDVYIKYGAREKVKRGNFWPAIVRLKMLKEPSKVSADADDVPF